MKMNWQFHISLCHRQSTTDEGMEGTGTIPWNTYTDTMPIGIFAAVTLLPYSNTHTYSPANKSHHTIRFILDFQTEHLDCFQLHSNTNAFIPTRFLCICLMTQILSYSCAFPRMCVVRPHLCANIPFSSLSNYAAHVRHTFESSEGKKKHI